MSDKLPGGPHDPDAKPLNERSSAFIDVAAFLNFLRLKSRVASRAGSEPTIAATGAGQALMLPLVDQGKTAVLPSTKTAMEVEIEDEDWDSLFGAIEERLRDTVETLDSSTPQLASQDNLLRIKSVVLDCVSSLDALHTALRHDRGLHLASRPERNSAGARLASRPTSAIDSNREH